VHRDRTTSGGSLPCPWSSASPPGGALVPSSLPTVLEVAREALPSLGWARGVAERRNRRRGGAARALSLRLKFEGLRPLFMGLLVPDRSREKVLAILSLIELNPALVGEKSRRGRIPFGYNFVSSSGTTPCVLGQLGRCTARGEGKGRDGSRASAGGRPLWLGRAGLRRSEGEGGGCWAGLGFRLGFSPQSE
jgi:hypothetical protein